MFLKSIVRDSISKCGGALTRPTLVHTSSGKDTPLPLEQVIVEAVEKIMESL